MQVTDDNVTFCSRNHLEEEEEEEEEESAMI